MKYLITLGAFLLLMASCTSTEENTTDIDGTTFPDVNALSGSYANLIAVGDFLYVIGETDLITYEQNEDKSLNEIDRQVLGLDLESLYYRSGVLFVGSSQRMYILSLTTDFIPVLQSRTQYSDLSGALDHCDPIVADQEVAYVSLSSSLQTNDDGCGVSEVNIVRAYDITDLNAPTEISEVTMESPKGLALDGDLLFVCESQNGLKVLDVSDPRNPTELYHFPDFETRDAVATGTSVLIVGPNNLYEYDYSDSQDIHQIWSVEL